MAEKRCPNCRLLNPPNAQRCDCGYNFDAQRVQAPIPGSVQGVKNGIRGWLAFLVLGLTVFGPLFGFGRLSGDFQSAEHMMRGLSQNTQWANYKEAVWVIFFFASGISISGGLALATRFLPSTVPFAMTCLWLSGPGSGIANLIAGFAVFGMRAKESAPEMVGGIIGTVVAAAIWTAYLAKSKRVRATYLVGDHERAS